MFFIPPRPKFPRQRSMSAVMAAYFSFFFIAFAPYPILKQGTSPLHSKRSESDNVLSLPRKINATLRSQGHSIVKLQERTNMKPTQHKNPPRIWGEKQNKT
mmetsp:Transcript_60643/g.70294  ORF Transcript_60643/g.70294 Transcript_60643/m.70294 type:complete len:101 (+) Transcript_60643:1563-1865(+)